MKKFFIVLVFTLNIIGMIHAENNPFFQPYNTPFNTFKTIKAEHFEPAFDKAIAELQEEINMIANSTTAPTFANTVVALERSGELLN